MGAVVYEGGKDTVAHWEAVGNISLAKTSVVGNLNNGPGRFWRR
jgi:hypothetical protein